MGDIPKQLAHAHQLVMLPAGVKLESFMAA
jgi:hypothetical protein